MDGALGRRGHAAEAHTHVRDRSILHAQAVDRRHGRDILIAPLAELVAEERFARPELGQGDALDHLVRRQRRLAIADEEFFFLMIPRPPRSTLFPYTTP